MLSDLKIKNAKARAKVYRIADGGGLCLEVRPNGSKCWRCRYRFEDVPKMLSLGMYPDIPLALARVKRDELKAQVARGVDPSGARKQEKAREITFGEMVEGWHAVAKKRLDPKHACAVHRRLERDVLPYLGEKAIAGIKPPEVLEVLKRVEARGVLETAKRLRGLCSQVFRFAISSGVIEHDPTANLRGAIAAPKETHFAALVEPSAIAGYMRAIKGYEGGIVVRAALLVGAYTFVRPGNLRAAEWSEFTLEGDSPVWKIPGHKMKIKTEKDFVVPLAPQVVKILEGLRGVTGGSAFVFPSPRTPSRCMSDNAVTAALRRMGFGGDEMTGHGVRAMARTVCHEVLGFAPDVIEEQLAHAKMGALGGAYDRTTHMPERVRLMNVYADWLDSLTV